MNEHLSEVIRIRVTPSHAARLGEAAALSGLSLSNYVRRRLSADDMRKDDAIRWGIGVLLAGSAAELVMLLWK